MRRQADSSIPIVAGVSAACIGIGLAVVPAGAPSAQPTSADDHWISVVHPDGLDGEVDAMIPMGSDLIVAGDFTACGEVPLDRVARWDGTSWHPMGAGFNRKVRSLFVHYGTLVAGGEFDMSGTDSVAHVARWDGSRWLPMGKGFDAAVLDLSTLNDQIVCSGEYSHSGAVGDFEFLPDPTERRRFATVWDGSEWRTLGDDADLAQLGEHPRFLTDYQGTLLAGGAFQDPQTPGRRYGIAAWDGARWQPFGPDLDAGPDGHPRFRVFAQIDSFLVVGGDFNTADSVTANGVLVWNGQDWQPLGQGPPDPVACIAFVNGHLLAGCIRGGITRVYWWSGTSWVLIGDELSGYIRSLGGLHGRILAGGRFELSGGRLAYLMSFQDFTWIPATGDTWEGLDCPVVSIRARGDELVVGEKSSWLGDAYVRLAGDTLEALGGGSTTSGWLHSFHGVRSWWSGYWKQPGTVVLGDDLFRVRKDGIGSWNGEGWDLTPVTFSSNANTGYTGPTCVVEYGGQLAVGGLFTQVDDVPANAMAVWDGSAWQALGSGIQDDRMDPDYPLHPQVRALAASGDTLVAGGTFTIADGLPANNVALWDGTAWSNLGSGVDDLVESLAFYKGNIIAGGFFNQAGDSAASGIARWDGGRWHPLGSGVDGPVFAMLPYRGRLVVGGHFRTAGGQAASGLASWDGVGWSPMGSGVDGEILALGEWKGDLYVGGEFGAAGRKTSYHLARWHGVDPRAMFTTLSATRGPEGTTVLWETRELPFDHLGFLVFREGFDGERVRLTEAPLEGTGGEILDEQPPLGASTYWLAGETATGKTLWYRSVTVSAVPGLKLVLRPNQPNPFPASGTLISFVNGVKGRVTLTVFDIAGHRVKRLVDRTLPPGEFSYAWDGRDGAGRRASAGVYFYRLKAPQGVLARKMIKTG